MDVNHVGTVCGGSGGHSLVLACDPGVAQQLVTWEGMGANPEQLPPWQTWHDMVGLEVIGLEGCVCNGRGSGGNVKCVFSTG